MGGGFTNVRKTFSLKRSWDPKSIWKTRKREEEQKSEIGTRHSVQIKEPRAWLTEMVVGMILARFSLGSL